MKEMLNFNKWFEMSEAELAPLIKKAEKARGGLPSIEFEEALKQSYFNYKLVKITWILVIFTILVSILNFIAILLF